MDQIWPLTQNALVDICLASIFGPIRVAHRSSLSVALRSTCGQRPLAAVCWIAAYMLLDVHVPLSLFSIKCLLLVPEMYL